MAKFCAYCGKPLDEGALFFGKCGKAVAGGSVLVSGRGNVGQL